MKQSVRSLLGFEWNPLSIREKTVSAVSGAVAIAFLIYITHIAVGIAESMCIIASMGASAVLLFAAPHGQLSQPWPVVMGHVGSAMVGVTCAKLFGHEWWVGGLAVGLSILSMQLLRCLHPPGGATALSAVMGGATIRELGFDYVIWPVGLNAFILLALAVVINGCFSWRRYPAFLNQFRKKAPAHAPEAERTALMKALKSLDSFVDLSEADLEAVVVVLERERHARILKSRRQFETQRMVTTEN